MIDRRGPEYLRPLTVDQREILAFAMKWLPFGGGDEDILPQFGIKPENFYRRLSIIIESRSCGEMDLATRNRLRELCRRKLILPPSQAYSDPDP
ncbi:DUF3263 domain-containing protein [Nocardia sp. NPDC004711]